MRDVFERFMVCIIKSGLLGVPGVGDDIDFVFHKVAEATDQRGARGKRFFKKLAINPVVFVPVRFVGQIAAHLNNA